MRRRHHSKLLGLLALVSAVGCGRREEASASPIGGDQVALDAPALAELSFVPADAEAVVRLDLVGLAARSPDASRTLEFVLQAQQPYIHRFLQGVGIGLGKEIRTLVLFAGAGDAYAVAALGEIDDARVLAELRHQMMMKTRGVVEAVAGGTMLTWKKVAPGAAETPELVEDVAVGVQRGLLLAGTPALVRQALLCRAGNAPAIRSARLARDVAAQTTSATVWGVAAPGPGAALTRLVPGLVHARFTSEIAAPGPDRDGLLDLRAEFGSPAEAEAFRAKLDGMLSTMATLGGKSKLGTTFSRLRDSAKVKVEGTTVVARSTM